MQSKVLSTSIDSGVFIMKEDFARGFDIKFSCDAYVIIFNEKSRFKASLLEQMVGRANRSQGV